MSKKQEIVEYLTTKGDPNWSLDEFLENSRMKGVSSSTYSRARSCAVLKVAESRAEIPDPEPDTYAKAEEFRLALEDIRSTGVDIANISLREFASVIGKSVEYVRTGNFYGVRRALLGNQPAAARRKNAVYQVVYTEETKSQEALNSLRGLVSALNARDGSRLQVVQLMDPAVVEVRQIA